MIGRFLRWTLCAALLAGLAPAGQAVGQAVAQTSQPGTLRGLDLPGLTPQGGARQDAPADSVFRTKHVTAELLSEHVTLRPGTTAWVALVFRIIPKWHTYWRNAGDSGEATRIEWDLPKGYAAGGIVWLPPKRIPVGPLVNYGYSGEAIHMVPISVPKDARPGETATLNASASWLVCEEVCIPEVGVLTLDLPVAGGQPIADFRAGPIFAKARAALPKPSPWTAEYRFGGNGFRLDVTAEGLKRDVIEDVWFYPYGHGVVKYAAPQKLTVTDRSLTLETQRGKAAKPITDVGGLLVVKERLGDGMIATQAFRLTATKAAAPPLIGFWEAVVLALLGGLILNLMPCVLPVLAVKGLSFARHANSGRGEGRGMARHGAAYTVGVLASFAVVGAILLAVRSAGAAAGWGFQLQEPVFVLLMAYLMVLIGLNFAGLFEIGGRFAGIGGALAGRSGLSGSFFTGVLAVIVATPCTAPFMGAAVGFALGQTAAVAMAVMLALGLGLALPFLLLSLSPALLRLIPKPGPWMVRFKQFLAFPMFATAAWLIWVLSLQAGDAALLGALAGAVLIAFAVWLWQASASAAPRWRPAGIGLAAAAIVAALAMVRFAESGAPVAETPGPNAAADSGGAAVTGIAWQPFSEARLAALRAQGRPVFINFTAAWCITCIANEQVVLRLESVRKAVDSARMATLKGDWTRRDPVITEHLARFGRSGVPLYVIYPPEGSPKEPMVLPQILTEGGTVAAIRSMAAETKRAERPRDRAAPPGPR